MDETDKIELKKSMTNKDEIKLKECIITDDGVACKIDEQNHQKMMDQKKVPVNLTITVEKEIPKNKTIDGTQSTEETKSIDKAKSTKADSSNKQECGCFKTTDYSKIANYVAKYLQNEEN